MRKIPNSVVRAVAEAMEPWLFEPTPSRLKSSGSHATRMKKLQREEMKKARKGIHAFLDLMTPSRVIPLNAAERQYGTRLAARLRRKRGR